MSSPRTRARIATTPVACAIRSRISTARSRTTCSRSGSNRSPHGATFEYDDHRQGHRSEEERRFAKRIAEAIQERLKTELPDKLIMAVEPQLLGLLRQALNGQLKQSLEVVELAKDFSWHTPRHVQEALEPAIGMLPINYPIRVHT